MNKKHLFPLIHLTTALVIGCSVADSSVAGGGTSADESGSEGSGGSDGETSGDDGGGSGGAGDLGEDCAPEGASIASLIEDIDQAFAKQHSDTADFVRSIFGEGAVKITHPGGSSMLSHFNWSPNYKPLLGDARKTYAWAWDSPSSRYAVWNFYTINTIDDGSTPELDEPLYNQVRWLLNLGPDGDQTGASKIIAVADGKNKFREPMVKWLGEKFPGATVIDCEAMEGTACLEEVDLIVDIPSLVAANNPYFDTIQEKMKEGVPLLALGHGTTEYEDFLMFDTRPSNLSEEEVEGTGGSDAFIEWSSTQELADALLAQTQAEVVNDLLRRIRDQDFVFDLSLCEAGDCSDYKDVVYKEFGDAAGLVKENLSKVVNTRNGIFDFEDGEADTYKSFVWLGDLMRQEISFPIPRTIEQTRFISLYLANRSVYEVRDCNPSQPDLGSFSRRNFSHITPKTVTRTYEQRKDYFSNGWFPAKVYALPGQTFTVTRENDLDSKIRIKINPLRSGSTVELAEEHDRPKYLQSDDFILEPGESRSFTPTYGGTIQIDTPKELSEDGTDAFVLHFEGVGEHPVWDGTESTEQFKEMFRANDFDWVEFITPGFIFTSTREKFIRSLEMETHTTIEELAEKTWRYIHQDVRNLHGVHGEGLGHSEAIEKFCESHNWDCSKEIHVFEGIQRGNFDRATCGVACSGNPFDSHLRFHAIGGAIIHEIGHNIEGIVPCMYRSCGHMRTNLWRTHVKKSYQWEEFGERHARLEPEVYEALQEAACSNNPTETARHLLWDKANNKETFVSGGSLSFYYHMAASNGDMPHLGDEGWDIYPIQAIHRRLFKRGVKNEDEWEMVKDSLGFSSYSYEDAKSLGDKDIELSDNDYGLIAFSYISKRDQRPIFEAFGLFFSDKASLQVDSFGFDEAEPFFHFADIVHPDYEPLPIDCTTTWPYGEGEDEDEDEIDHEDEGGEGE